MSELCSIEAEQALLGAFFMRPALLASLASIIEPKHFSEYLHQRIAAVMIQVHAEGGAITPVTLAPHFAFEEKIGDLTVAQYFGRLTAAAVTLNAAPYARLVRDFSVRRELYAASVRAQQLAADMERTPAQAAVDAVMAFDGIVSAAHLSRKTLQTAEDAASSLVADLDREEGEPPVPTGFADLDNVIGGFTRGDYHILAGRPSMGKTAIGGAFILNAARHGIGTMFFSLEMRTPSVMARMFSDMLYNRDTPVPYRDILRHRANPKRWRLNDHQLYRIREAKAQFDSLPLVIDDQSSLSVAEIGARVRRQAAKWEEIGIDLQFVAIDHKDFIRPDDRYSGQKEAETAQISASLKSMFKELNIAGLLLCQLNRDVEKRDNQRPDLHDLRGSGALEQDGDLIMFPYREAYYLEKRLDDPGEDAERLSALRFCEHNLEMGIAKQRNGERTTVDLWVDMANNAIRNKLKG